MKEYEATFIFSQEEEKFKLGLEKVKKLLAKAGAEITKEDDLGIRDLAYLIKKESKAHYMYFEIKIDPSKIQGLDKSFNLLNPLLKYLFVCK